VEQASVARRYTGDPQSGAQWLLFIVPGEQGRATSVAFNIACTCRALRYRVTCLSKHAGCAMGIKGSLNDLQQY